MAMVKLIKFVAVAILAPSSAAEPTNRSNVCGDETVTLQVGYAGHCHCGDVCPAYNKNSKYSCSDAKESYLASNPPGLDQEAFSQMECNFKRPQGSLSGGNMNCWSHSGGDLTVHFQPPGGGDSIVYDTSLNVVCPNGWCECRGGGAVARHEAAVRSRLRNTASVQTGQDERTHKHIQQTHNQAAA
ncbi:unnamed protein product [Polarella glacialis]|uniref:Secreted protein n=1 Tax=Polarella glacialis TaxID=89957 RepID=A0A813FNC8_POLGL|nr:unnamed protein product [Polarella glacialis]